MKTRLYDAEDYQTVRPWWDIRGETRVPKELLPSLGVVVEDASDLVAASWLYRDVDGKLGWVAWTVTNPANSAFRSARAIQLLLGAMVSLAEEFSIPLLYAQVMQSGLSKAFQRAGFQNTHIVNQMIRPCLPPLSFST